MSLEFGCFYICLDTWHKYRAWIGERATPFLRPTHVTGAFLVNRHLCSVGYFVRPSKISRPVRQRFLLQLTKCSFLARGIRIPFLWRTFRCLNTNDAHLCTCFIRPSCLLSHTPRGALPPRASVGGQLLMYTATLRTSSHKLSGR